MVSQEVADGSSRFGTRYLLKKTGMACGRQVGRTSKPRRRQSSEGEGVDHVRLNLRRVNISSVNSVGYLEFTDRMVRVTIRAQTVKRVDSDDANLHT